MDVSDKIVDFFLCGIPIVVMVFIFLYAVCVNLREARRRRRRRNSLMAERIARLRQIIAASTSSAHPDPRQQTALPSSVIDFPPAFAYGPAKGTEPRECSVCLSLVAGGARVRMLPNCTHVFHVECIDMWLSSHPTCPVCRAEAVPQWVRPEEKAVVEARVQPSAPPLGGVIDMRS